MPSLINKTGFTLDEIANEIRHKRCITPMNIRVIMGKAMLERLMKHFKATKATTLSEPDSIFGVPFTVEGDGDYLSIIEEPNEEV